MTVSLLYGLLIWGEEKLTPTLLMQEQRQPQIHINQTTGVVCKSQGGWLTM